MVLFPDSPAPVGTEKGHSGDHSGDNHRGTQGNRESGSQSGGGTRVVLLGAQSRVCWGSWEWGWR